ncbi:Conserved_hypothetical protein [Hexamita inflata]|uniref:Uncharacterized protein n=1 Tax=Hexamita inflata TaxID=28002 RepID=A0AA86TVP7_9EUKA|nr:Conserved hypothetical protein [Hexamita inflata]
MLEVQYNGLDRKDIMPRLFEHYIDESDHKVYTRCKLCKEYTKKSSDPNMTQLMGHLMSPTQCHQFTLENVFKKIGKIFKPIQTTPVYSDEDRLTDAIMQIVKEGLPFSHVGSKEYRKLTGTSYTRQFIAQEINKRADIIATTQFERYPIVADDTDDMMREQVLIIWDGFMCTQHRHAYFFAAKTKDYIHFLGLRYTEEKQNALWLAAQMKDIIDQLEATKRV